MATTQPLLCHRNFLEPLRLDVCAPLSKRRCFLLMLGSRNEVGDISVASLLFGAPRSVPCFCFGYSELIYKERSPCGRLLTVVFHIPSEKLYITTKYVLQVSVSTNSTGKLWEKEPTNTAANVFVSTQFRTDNCCGPKREKPLWDFRSGRHRVTASSEVDYSSMYGVAPVWTFCVGRENGVAAFST